jgi:hypothetical protein
MSAAQHLPDYLSKDKNPTFFLDLDKQQAGPVTKFLKDNAVVSTQSILILLCSKWVVLRCCCRDVVTHAETIVIFGDDVADHEHAS